MTHRTRFEDVARRILPPDVFAYYAAGSGEGVTVAEEEDCWDRLCFRPRVLRDVSRLSTSATVLSTSVAAPLLIAPTALHALVAHPEGEVATARAARAAGCLMVPSEALDRRDPDDDGGLLDQHPFG